MFDGKSVILWVIFLSLTLQSLASLYLLNHTIMRLDKIIAMEQSLAQEKESLASFLSLLRNDLTTLHDHWKIVNAKLDVLNNNNLIIPNSKPDEANDERP